jgi:hypothetical protein
MNTLHDQKQICSLLIAEIESFSYLNYNKLYNQTSSLMARPKLIPFFASPLAVGL